MSDETHGLPNGGCTCPLGGPFREICPIHWDGMYVRPPIPAMPAAHRRMEHVVTQLGSDPLHAPQPMTVGQLRSLLAAHDDDAPLLILFDGGAGVAKPMYLLSNLSDAPDWADPRTVYIDTEGG